MLVSKSIASSFSLFARRQSLAVGETAPTRLEIHLARIFAYENVKRAFDIFGSLALIIVFAPVMGISAVLVGATSRGPIIFRQQRLTRGGEEFTMYKFRTMRLDAEAGMGAVWASDADPRVTRVGRFLRLSRLDELPQLFNVLVGDMSLIGPRPERPELARQLEQEIPLFGRRIEVKAGITGLAQVASGYAASIGSYRTKLAFDIEYVENRSLALDLEIAWKTLKVMLTGAGAR